MYVIPSETKLFHVSRADILYEHVGFLQEFGEDFLASGSLMFSVMDFLLALS